MDTHTSNITLAEILAIAERLLELSPQPVPRWRLLRDILRLPESDHELGQARAALDTAQPVRELAGAQLVDGSWGRFHTQDTTLKQRFPTTEYAIERALALGLDNRHPVLAHAQDYIERHLRGEVTWSDRVEGHNTNLWLLNISFISAGRLAQLDPNHDLLREKVDFMHCLLAGSFRQGVYSAEAEFRTRQVLSGIPERTHWSLISNQYGVMLLGAGQPLPEALEGTWLSYILHNADGIYYVNNTPPGQPPVFQTTAFSGWLHAHELLSRMPRWHTQAKEVMRWLWQQRNEEGLWDMGAKAGRSAFLPLSDDWRRRTDRVIDCSVRILALLRQWVDANIASS
jgi:hypothetical protein